LTTTIEGLSKEEKRGMQKLADEWNEKAHRTNKRESRYLILQTAHLISSLSMYQKYLKPS